MTATIVTLSAAWIYCVMVAFTLFFIMDEPLLRRAKIRIALLWFLLWPAVLLAALRDWARGRRYV